MTFAAAHTQTPPAARLVLLLLLVRVVPPAPDAPEPLHVLLQRQALRERELPRPPPRRLQLHPLKQLLRVLEPSFQHVAQERARRVHDVPRAEAVVQLPVPDEDDPLVSRVRVVERPGVPRLDQLVLLRVDEQRRLRVVKIGAEGRRMAWLG